MKIPVFGYLRVSSDGQAGEDKDGLSRQRTAIDRFIMSHFHKYKLAEVFSDEGVSGTVPHSQRPAFKRMLATLFGNGVRTVVIEDVDRLGRDAEVILSAIGDFKRAGFTLLTSKGQDLTSTAVDARLKTGIDAVIAEYARGQIVERLKAGRERRRLAGERYCGRIPYGYMKQNGELVPNPKEQKVLDRMRELRAAGLNMRQITNKLNEEQLKPRSADQWHADVVARVLRRGKVRHDEDSIG